MERFFLHMNSGDMGGAVVIDRPPAVESSPTTVFDTNLSPAADISPAEPIRHGIASKKELSGWIGSCSSPNIPDEPRMTEVERAERDWRNALLNHMRHR